ERRDLNTLIPLVRCSHTVQFRGPRGGPVVGEEHRELPPRLRRDASMAGPEAKSSGSFISGVCVRSGRTAYSNQPPASPDVGSGQDCGARGKGRAGRRSRSGGYPECIEIKYTVLCPPFLAGGRLGSSETRTPHRCGGVPCAS